MRYKAYKYRIYPNREQQELINKHIGCCRYVYNLCLEKKINAYHEAGHAILFHVLPDVGPVHTVSIIPTGMGAAGYTMPLPAQNCCFLSIYSTPLWC